MLRLMVVTTVLILTQIGVGLAPTLSYIKPTNEGSHTYGYWRGSLTGPQFAPGSNWNPNTCGLSPSSIVDNPKGAVIPAVTNTTACEDGKVGVATML